MTGVEVNTSTATPLTGSEESWAIIEEVFNKLQPFYEQCTGVCVCVCVFCVCMCVSTRGSSQPRTNEFSNLYLQHLP